MFHVVLHFLTFFDNFHFFFFEKKFTIFKKKKVSIFFHHQIFPTSTIYFSKSAIFAIFFQKKSDFLFTIFQIRQFFKIFHNFPNVQICTNFTYPANPTNLVNPSFFRKIQQITKFYHFSGSFTNFTFVSDNLFLSSFFCSVCFTVFFWGEFVSQFFTFFIF